MNGLSPRTPVPNSPNDLPRNAEACGELTLAGRARLQAGPYLRNIGRGEFHQHAPMNVDRMGYWLEMIGVDAKSDTTQVVNDEPIRDRPVCLLVIEPMRPDGLLASPHCTVSLAAGCTLPNPARRLVSAIFDGINDQRPPSVVASDVSMGLPPNHAPLRIGDVGYRRGFAAAALAQAGRIGAFAGKLWMRHLSSSLTGLGERRAPGCLRSAGVFACPNYTTGRT
jgi:hypothetical protein